MTGLSVALDLPTQIGFDADDPSVGEEVGRVGVAIDSLADMELLFDGIPLEQVSTNFTINTTSAPILAMYIAVGAKQGVPPEQLRGTLQNDPSQDDNGRQTRPAYITAMVLGCLKMTAGTKFSCPELGPRTQPTVSYFGSLIGFSA